MRDIFGEIDRELTPGERKVLIFSWVLIIGGPVCGAIAMILIMAL